MTSVTVHPSFRETVALVAARAKEKLPVQVNGRVESAVKLVLGHDVEPQADGSILVGSSSDPMKQYRLEGATCTCQDFVHGKAPEGWCQHRIAAGIHKRCQQEMSARSTPVETEVLLSDEMEPYPDNDHEEVEMPPTPAPVPLPEAPASVNVRLTIGGREVQWTLRDSDEGRLAVRLEAMLARYPLPQAQAPAQPLSPQLSPQQFNALAMHRPVEGVCAIHQVPMRENAKNGRRWFSHRLPEGGFCKGR